MKNTVFDYDSSDGEEELNKKLKTINNISVDSNILYNAGNVVLHHKSVLKKYQTQKKQIGYKSSLNPILINKFLTQKKYDNEDKSIKSLNSLLHNKDYNQEKDNSNIQIVVNSHKLYNKIQELAFIQNKEAAIDTLDWTCFKVLQKHLDKIELNDTNSIQEIGKAFGILNQDKKTADENKTKDFFQEIQKTIDKIKTKEIIENLLALNLDSKLLSDEIVSTIITESDAINTKVNAIFSTHQKFGNKVNIVNEANKLYNKIQELAFIQNKEAAIDTLDWTCFKVLQKHLDKIELNDTNSIQEIGKAFGILNQDKKTADENKTKDFFQEIPNKQESKKTIQDLLNLVKQSTTLLNNEIKTHVTSKKQTANFDFGIRILCDEQLASHKEQSPSLSNQLSQFDSIVNGKIQELSFFNNSNDEQVNAKDFLASSLIYQKLLKTITKFTSLRTHGNEIDTKIQYNEVWYHNKGYPKVIDTKSKLSTGLKRTEEISGLGNYNNISKMLQQAQEELELNNQQLIKAFQDILKGKDLHNQYKTSPDAVKILYDITYLLFSCEPNRNPEALISNAMFLELIKRGEYQITDMATKLPMAMSSGKNKQGAIEIGRYYHEQYEKQKADNRARKNDYGKSKLKDNSSEVQEFQEREQNLLKDFLGFNNWPIKPLLDVKQIKTLLKDYVNKIQHPEFRENKETKDAKIFEENIKHFTPDMVLDYLEELTFNKVKTGKQQELKDAKSNAQKVVNNYDQELKKYEQDLDKINVKILIEINKLIKEWYGFDNVLTSNTALGTNHDADNGHFKGGSKKYNDNADDSDSNYSNEFDHKHKQNHGKQTQIDTNSRSNTNKYCSILVEKYENYQDSTSGIINIQFQPLDYGSCTKIDNEALSKLQWIIDHKDPASRKRSYYEAFPEELHYSNVFEKRFKLSEYEVIKKYYMPYCLAVSESAIIERLVNSEFLFSHGEYNLYSRQYNSYNIGFIKKSLINAGLLNRDESQLNKEFDKWCKIEWDSPVMGAYKHFSQTPSNTTQEVYKPIAEDIHVFDNAANKTNSFSYQYQCSDIRYVGKQLFDNLKENINWIGDVGEGHIDLDASNLLPEEINKPVGGVYNIGNFHWIGFAIKKIGADFFVFYKDSLNNKEIDGSFKKLINEKYSEQGKILYFSHAGNEQTESKKTACGVFALKNACTIATKINLNELGANKDTCEREFDNIEFTKQEDIPTLRENYGNLYALEFTTQLQDSYKTNIIKEIIRALHDTDIEALIHSITEKLQGTNLNDVHFVKIKGNEVFDNYKNQARTIGIEVYLADQNLLSLENYQHFVQIHFSKDIDQNTLLNQLNDLNLQNIPLSNLLGIIYEPTEEKQYSLSQAKLQSEQYLLEEAIQKKIESDIQEALGQLFNAKSFKVEKSIMTKKYHVEKEIQPLDWQIEILAKTLDAFLKQWKLEIETKNQIKGVAKEGLTPESIKINLDAIIEAKQDNTYFYVAPKIMNQEELLSSMDDWQNIPSTYYVALIKLENESGDKHAVLFQASKALDHLAITITDPLSQEASTFKLKIENLAESLHAEGRDIKVVYSGRQDKDYGTCGDMCLIMLQELIEKSVNKTITSFGNEIIIDQYVDIEQINNLSPIFDYDHHQIEIVGDIISLH